MLAGRSGTVEDGNGRIISRWALDEDGFFAVSVEKPGEYGFRFLDLNEQSMDCTFGVTVIGAGGGGGGAHIDPDEDDRISETRLKQYDGVGEGGSGGETVRVEWSDSGGGLRIADYLRDTAVKIGKGGDGGRAFCYCKCGGSACPIGHRSSCPWCFSDNNGKAGGESSFGLITASGGLGGRAGENTEGRYSSAQASSGDAGAGAGKYVFWGVVSPCGNPGTGGCFGGNSGSAGNPYLFHFGWNSFGHSGITLGGHGNGGAGGGLSYAYGHPMFTGTGTGTGKGSYSPVVRGTAAGGGDTASINGYLYLEGKIRFGEDSGPARRIQLTAEVLPGTVNPVPKLVWASTNAYSAKVSQTGAVLLKNPGTAIITATAPNGVQGFYLIRNPPSEGSGQEEWINLSLDGSLLTAGDTAQMKAFCPLSTGQIIWSSTNPAAVTVDSEGRVTAKSHGSAVITASLPGGVQGFYYLTAGDPGGESSFRNLTADRSAAFVGDTAKTCLTPPPGDYSEVRWTLSNPDIASFDPDTGTVFFLEKGIVTLTAESSAGSSSWTFRVTDGEYDAAGESGGRNPLPDLPSGIADLAVCGKPAEGRTYTVKPGDSLEELVTDVYGNPAYLPAVIAVSNRKALREGLPVDPMSEEDPQISPGRTLYFAAAEELESWFCEQEDR